MSNDVLPKIRVVFDMPAEEYHAQESLSNSLLKYLGEDDTPLDFWRQSWMNLLRAEENEDTKAKKFGRAAHMLCLEGEDMFNQHFSLTDKEIKGKRVMETSEDGKLGQKEWDTLMNVRDHLLKHPLASIILKGCKAEVSMFAELEVEMDDRGNTATVPVRCRHDIWKPGYTADLKFVDEVNLGDVAKDISNYAYDKQASFYTRIMGKCQPELEHQNFITIFVEKRPKGPLKVLPVAFSPTVMAVSRQRVDARIARYVKYMNAYGTQTPWPAFENRIHTVWAPGEGDGKGVELHHNWNFKS